MDFIDSLNYAEITLPMANEFCALNDSPGYFTGSPSSDKP